MGQGRQEKVATSLAGAVSEEISASLAPVDAELARRYPGDPGTRQPVHTVYVPADVFAADTVRSWGERALAALDEHAPDAASFAAVLGLSDDLAEPVYARVRAKLEREPVEDMRVDFEDGVGIDGAKDFVGGHADADIECISFAAVHLVDDHEVGVESRPVSAAHGRG